MVLSSSSGWTLRASSLRVYIDGNLIIKIQNSIQINPIT